MAEPFIGEIRMVGFNFAPVGWAFCDGSLLLISEFEALFTLIGTTYGGDGQNTFALPNLQSRIPMHQGADPASGITYTIGQVGGTEAVTLLSSQMPVHSHAVADAGRGTLLSPTNAIWAGTSQDVYSTGGPSGYMGPAAPQGGNQPHDNLPPFLVINFIISLFGIFPSPS
jgi:microcystin-dependent protein